ncbi:MAG: DEAD/DEAH box helicase [Desulfurella sp.]|uniref:DEAD/DEAH box helicase n=1 Tax=Desulfurella sp. TaxID=1962857 RepID=UPI003D0BA9B6
MQRLEKFANLGISENILKSLLKKGYEEPTPIQEQVIPLMLKTNIDLIAQAQTGTGKTASFGVPIIEKAQEKLDHIQCLILTPTRELAIQISQELNSLKGTKKLKILPIYGGQSIDLQVSRLKSGIDIIVGTPGRILDHINRKTIDLSLISDMVLDEADEMLNMGFIDDVEEILKHTNDTKRLLMFSATIPTQIVSIAKRHMKNYEIIKTKKDDLTANLTQQIYFEVNYEDKFQALCRIIDMQKEFYALVFCKTKIETDELANKLQDAGYNALALHGDMTQKSREIVLNKFKRKSAQILIATDVAARGIDIENLTHVINYSIPENVESYIHRIGRTGRAGKSGIAITFVTPNEYNRLIYMLKTAKLNIKKQGLPTVEEIISFKINKIQTEIENLIQDNHEEKYTNLANKLLEQYKPTEVVAALLKYNFKEELDEKNYHEIKEVKPLETYSKTRLFVALGRQDSMTPKKLIDFIKQQIEINERDIKDIRIFDKFSFVSVPFEEAQVLLQIFKKKSNTKSLITKAREKND